MNGAHKAEKRANSDWVEELGKPPHNLIPAVPMHEALSPREKQAMTLLAEGNTVKFTASIMGVSKSTAADWEKHIYAKLGIHTRAQLARCAVALGLVELIAGEDLQDRIAQYASLSQRAKEALQNISNGLKLEDVGLAMGISRNTVNDYAKQIYEAFNINDGRVSVENGGSGDALFDPMTTAGLYFTAIKLEAIRLYKEKHPENGATQESAAALPATSVSSIQSMSHQGIGVSSQPLR